MECPELVATYRLAVAKAEGIAEGCPASVAEGSLPHRANARALIAYGLPIDTSTIAIDVSANRLTIHGASPCRICCSHCLGDDQWSRSQSGRDRLIGRILIHDSDCVLGLPLDTFTIAPYEDFLDHSHGGS